MNRTLLGFGIALFIFGASEQVFASGKAPVCEALFSDSKAQRSRVALVDKLERDPNEIGVDLGTYQPSLSSDKTAWFLLGRGVEGQVFRVVKKDANGEPDLVTQGSSYIIKVFNSVSGRESAYIDLRLHRKAIAGIPGLRVVKVLKRGGVFTSRHSHPSLKGKPYLILEDVRGRGLHTQDPDWQSGSPIAAYWFQRFTQIRSTYKQALEANPAFHAEDPYPESFRYRARVSSFLPAAITFPLTMQSTNVIIEHGTGAIVIIDGQ